MKIVACVQRMQDIAVEHDAFIRGVEAQGASSTSGIREHKIEHLLPVFEGEEIEIQTWIAGVREFNCPDSAMLYRVS